MRITRKQFLARGKRGIVSTGYAGREKIVMKERNAASAVDTIAHEARMLQLVNAHGIGPRYLAYERGVLFMEFIQGERLLDWISHAQQRSIRRVLVRLLEQCRELDRIGVSKRELTHPDKHVLIRRGVPVQIDFERCTYARAPKNVTQVCQYLTGARASLALASRGIHFDRARILAQAATYKKTYADEEFARLLALLRGRT